MSIQVANVNLSGATVGQKGTLVSFANLLPPPTIAQQMRPQDSADSQAHLEIFNETGCLLTITLPESKQSKTVPSGRWWVFPIPPHETEVDYTVVAVASNPLFNNLLADYYGPGEPVDDMGTLGNSPIGGTVPLAVAQVVNDGNPVGTTFVEATQVGAPSSDIKIDNGGNIIVAEWSVGAGSVTNIFQTSALVPAGNDVVKLGKPGNFWSHALGKFKVDGLSSLDNGAITTDGAGNAAGNSFKATGPGSGASFTASIPSTSTDPNFMIDLLDNTTGAIRWQIGKQAHVNGDAFRVIDATNGQEGIALVPNAGGMRIAGPITQIGGITTSGRGVAICAGSAFNVAVNSSALTTIVGVTSPSSNAALRLSVMFSIGAGNTNNGAITLKVNYTDPFTGAAASQFFLWYAQGGVGVTNLNALSLNKGGPQYMAIPMPLQVAVSTTVSVQYQNNVAGTIADKVTVIVEVVD